jgi:hypothetical protein
MRRALLRRRLRPARPQPPGLPRLPAGGGSGPNPAPPPPLLADPTRSVVDASGRIRHLCHRRLELTSHATVCPVGGLAVVCFPDLGSRGLQRSMVSAWARWVGAWGGRGAAISGCFATGVEYAPVCVRLRVDNAFAVSVTR